MARQFVAGQRFSREEFGVTCNEVWLPNSFGYSGALPQFVAAAGIGYFLGPPRRPDRAAVRVPRRPGDNRSARALPGHGHSN